MGERGWKTGARRKNPIGRALLPRLLGRGQLRAARAVPGAASPRGGCAELLEAGRGEGSRHLPWVGTGHQHQGGPRGAPAGGGKSGSEQDFTHFPPVSSCKPGRGRGVGAARQEGSQGRRATNGQGWGQHPASEGDSSQPRPTRTPQAHAHPTHTGASRRLYEPGEG